MTHFFESDLDQYIMSWESNMSKISVENTNSAISCTQIAYMARELRQNGVVTLTCQPNEVDMVFDQLTSFTSNSEVKKFTRSKPDSNEVLLEIINN